ncbi:hypothetical protein [Paraherbaspirillum soli]|uniref:Phr family secreted Rap phosphatase inhibitor n=1 Tax=Paraherbaspirillum soli TaxID=631222 RepID=A0ABW0M581_9BURK
MNKSNIVWGIVALMLGVGAVASVVSYGDSDQAGGSGASIGDGKPLNGTGSGARSRSPQSPQKATDSVSINPFGKS